MSIETKLNYLAETKKQIKSAIEGKGVSIANTDSFRSYADKIEQIQGGGSSTGSSEWKPELDWFDIETILESDTEDYSQKIICLLTDELDDGATTNIAKGATKYRLSDGQVIEHSASENLDITNIFNTSMDKQCSKGYKTRYIIYYSNADSMNITLPNNVIYTIFSGVKSSSQLRDHFFLQGIKFINNSLCTKTSMSYMFTNCRSLQGVFQIDTSNVTNMSSMFSGCYLLQNIPQMNTSNVIDMNSMFSSCYSLQNIPQMNTGNVTNMNSMFSRCYALQSIPQMDIGKVTNMSDMFSTCNSLYNITSIPIIGNSTSLFSVLYYLNHATLLRILNALVDLTGQTTQKLTLGSTNLAKLTDEEKAIATNKNWTLA